MPCSSGRAFLRTSRSEAPAHRALPIRPIANGAPLVLPEHSSAKVTARRGSAYRSASDSCIGRATRPVTSSRQSVADSCGWL